jgi:large subunit ribosomal protein L4
MLIPLKNSAGEQVGQIELNDAVFAAPVSKPLMHQALVRQLANARLGTHDTKERWEVSGGGKKPWRQKGTGRARQGSTRATQFIGGGTAFGPTPRKYTQALPKKMQRAALRSALTVKASAGQIIVVDQLAIDEPKTKAMVRLLTAVGATQGSTLMVLAEKSEPVWRSANNLPNVKAMLSGYLNVRDLLGYDTLMLSKDAVEYSEIWLGADAKPGMVETITEDEAVLLPTSTAPVASFAEAGPASVDDVTEVATGLTDEATPAAPTSADSTTEAES